MVWWKKVSYYVALFGEYRVYKDRDYNTFVLVLWVSSCVVEFVFIHSTCGCCQFVEIHRYHRNNDLWKEGYIALNALFSCVEVIYVLFVPFLALAGYTFLFFFYIPQSFLRFFGVHAQVGNCILGTDEPSDRSHFEWIWMTSLSILSVCWVLQPTQVITRSNELQHPEPFRVRSILNLYLWKQVGNICTPFCLLSSPWLLFIFWTMTSWFLYLERK